MTKTTKTAKTKLIPAARLAQAKWYNSLPIGSEVVLVADGERYRIESGKCNPACDYYYSLTNIATGAMAYVDGIDDLRPAKTAKPKTTKTAKPISIHDGRLRSVKNRPSGWPNEWFEPNR